MYGRHVDIRQVDGDLCDAIFFDIPPDGFYRLEATGDMHRFALRIGNDLPGNGIALPEYPSCLADIEGDGISAACRGGIEIHVVSDQEIPGADHRGAAFCVEYRGAIVGLPFRQLY